MRYINSRFTYLLTYLLNIQEHVQTFYHRTMWCCNIFCMYSCTQFECLDVIRQDESIAGCLRFYEGWQIPQANNIQ